jgi:mannosyltransferase PIG-V
VTELALERRFAASAWAREYGWLVAWWAAGRAVVLAAAAALHVYGPRVLAGRDERMHLFGILSSWDGRWYRIVAEHGYLLEPGRQSDPAFFPLYPLLLRGVHAFGLGYVTAGALLANLAFLAALVAFEALTRTLFHDARFARRATTYLAVFPVGVVFALSYPESIILLAVSLAALAALRGCWGWAAVLAAAATLGRPEALFVALPLFALALRARHNRGLAFGAAVAPLAALGSFALYLGIRLHDPLAWTRAERAWGRRFTPTGFVHAFAGLPRAFEGNAWIVRDVAFLVVYLALLAAAARAGTPRSWLVAGAIVVVLPLFSGAFTSISRFGLLAPAVYWGLAELGSRRTADVAIRIGSLVLLAASMFSLPYVFP